MRKLALVLALVAATPAWAMDPKAEAEADARTQEVRTRYRAIELCQKMGGTGAICVMKHSPEDKAVAFALVKLEACDSHDMAVRLGIQRQASWLAEHPGWTSENQTKECAADRAYIKQRWGY